MAKVDVENFEENARLFEEKMGFPHNAEGLNLTDDQLVNFLLLCYQSMVLPDEEEITEEETEDENVKVKVMKVNSGDMQGIMDEMLSPISSKKGY